MSRLNHIVVDYVVAIKAFRRILFLWLVAGARLDSDCEQLRLGNAGDERGITTHRDTARPRVEGRKTKAEGEGLEPQW